MERTNLLTRILLIGLCFLSSHLMALAIGQAKEPVRISTQEELLDVLSSSLRAGGETQDLYIEKDLLVDTVLVVRNTTPLRIYGEAFIRDEDFRKSLFVLESGANLTLESDINGANAISDEPEIVAHDGIPKNHKRVIFEIQSKNGRNISKISEFNGIFNPENQHEVLFDKRTKFLVVPDYKIDDDGFYRIKLIEQ